MKVFLKGNKGINLISLTIAVTVILILTGIIIVNSVSSLKSNKLRNMQADIDNLRDKISNYYSRYGEIPADRSIEYTNISHINSISEAVDTGAFFVIDLAAMENVTLNYGKDYEKIRNGEATTEEEINKLTDLYIINADSHNIFYVEGIELDGETFYTDYSEDDKDTASVEIVDVLIADGSWDDEKKVNRPVLKDNMEAVYWDEEGNEIRQGDENFDKTKWYDYDNNKWANVVVTIDGVESYFVWIPRYEYKITYKNEADISQGGIIEVKFIDIQTTTADSGYIIHPAFINDSKNNYRNGGWNEELPGIWVGKYETSLVKKSGKTDFSPESATTIDANTYAITIQPNKSSWRYATIDNQYTMAKSYSTSLNSHMLKNSEWGAVAYLTESKYGRNGTEVDMNDESYITAMGDMVKNKSQSSTGNETGIYDLSGGSYERVAAYLQDGSTSNGEALVTETDKKFVTVYTETSASSGYKLGDATYETSGWHGDYAYFVNPDFSFFHRGGSSSDLASSSGIFYFYSSSDISYSDFSFRMCLAVK